MTNMEWYVNNGSKLMRPHYMGSVRSHTCTTSVAYHSFFFFFSKNRLAKILFLKPFPKKARIGNLKNPDLDLIRKIHPECGFYGFMIQIWIFPKKTHPQPVLQGPVSLVRQLECKSIFLKVTLKKTPTRVIFSWLAWKFLERVNWMS